MFTGAKNGMALINECLNAFRTYPSLMIPLLACWVIYASVIVYLEYFFPWNNYSFAEKLSVIFLTIFLFSFILSTSFLVLLELIKQIETGKSPAILSATFSSVPNIIKSLPVTILWAVIWFVISVIEALLRKRSSDDNEERDFNAENVAKTVTGYEEFSLTAAFFNALKKGVRMMAFLIYPTVVWEKHGFFKSVKRGLSVARTHKTEFATGFVLTEMAAIIVFLPLAIIFALSDEFHIDMPDWIWFATIIYSSFAWSFAIFLEQMFIAELYMWHLLWEKECSIAQDNGVEYPKLQDIKRPSLLDNTPDLPIAMKM